MKSPIIILFMVTVSSLLHAQREEYTWDYITFEEPYRFLQLDTAASNIWKIGEPDKTIFNGAFAGSNAIFTGGTPGYPVNNHSVFTLVLSWENIDHYPYSVYIEFQHKLDTEEGIDGGFIEVSYDGGASWMNVIDDYSACISPGDGYMSEGMYTDRDRLTGGEHGFSGKHYFWETVRLGWEYCLVKDGIIEADSTILRFNFISDDNDTGQEGWMIDHIRLFSVKLSGSSRDDLAGSFRVYPNPATDEIFVDPVPGIRVVSLCLMDVSGKQVARVEDCTNMDISEIPQGLYLLEIDTNEGTATRKIIISPDN